MTPIMKRTEKDDAVSPVVGVMLMLVVTIIIAAVVAAFASGVAGDTEKVPSAMLKATVDSAFDSGGMGTFGTVLLTNVNGETIDTSKLKIRVVMKDGSEYTYAEKNPGVSSGVDYTKLPSGATLNAAYWCTADVDYANSKYWTDLKTHLTTMKTGDVVNVVVLYGDSSILYDKEVTVL